MPAARGTSAAVTVTPTSRGVLVGEARLAKEIKYANDRGFIAQSARVNFAQIFSMKFPTRTLLFSSRGLDRNYYLENYEAYY